MDESSRRIFEELEKTLAEKVIKRKAWWNEEFEKLRKSVDEGKENQQTIRKKMEKIEKELENRKQQENKIHETWQEMKKKKQEKEEEEVE